MANGGNPSSWVNLQDYLGLNADQGEQMGQAVYDNVTGSAQKAGTQLQQDTAGFNNAVAKGSVQGPTSTDPSQVDKSQAAANAGKSYSGPTDLASFDPTLEGNVANSIQQMQMAADPNQRGQVLQETFGSKAGGTTGDNAFDNFLTSSSEAGGRLAQFGPQFKALQDQLGVSEGDAYDKAQGAYASSADNAAKWQQLADGTAPTSPTAFHPGDYKTLEQFMDQGSPTQYAHEAAMYASPADWATRGLGELGYNGENVSQLFAGRFGASGNTDLTWNIGNLRSAARLVQDQYGDAALNKWFKSLTPETWKSYMDIGNAGGQARQMRAWLEANGMHKK